MSDGGNSDLILEAILSTHEQQLQTLRQGRLSLLRIASFNIVLLSMLLAFAGVAIQTSLPIGLLEFSIPIALQILAILLAIIKYRNLTEAWGYGLNREFVAEINSESRSIATEEIVGIYQNAIDKNRREIGSIGTWIFGIICIMCVSLGSLFGLIVIPA
ncbi:hypothetical protein ACFQMF_07365 [Halorubrum rutilum]|uniref:Uncharacterized protein n=1 Tax=Halorubrum rutilum TaxID=1364933 RepID=A0ABD6AJT2_9EURY|nr:hypothetical protein [Halorubrum rutilum]